MSEDQPIKRSWYIDEMGRLMLEERGTVFHIAEAIKFYLKYRDSNIEMREEQIELLASDIHYFMSVNAPVCPECGYMMWHVAEGQPYVCTKCPELQKIKERTPDYDFHY